MDDGLQPTSQPRADQPFTPFQEHPAAGRNTDGTFALGNVAAMKSGAYSRQVRDGSLAQQAEAREALKEGQAAIIADLGGQDAAGVLKRDAVQRYVALRLVEDWLTGNIIDHGPLTAKGRQRAALNALLQVSDRLTKLAALLGLERRSKDIRSMDVGQFLEHERQQRQAPQSGAPDVP